MLCIYCKAPIGALITWHSDLPMYQTKVEILIREIKHGYIVGISSRPDTLAA